jgi:hypothetical protein
MEAGRARRNSDETSRMVGGALVSGTNGLDPALDQRGSVLLLVALTGLGRLINRPAVGLRHGDAFEDPRLRRGQ